MQGHLIRTTVTLPEQLVKAAKYYAVRHQTSISQLVRLGLAQQIKRKEDRSVGKKSILDLAGRLKLGGRPMSARHELYDGE